jgi:hypothetical protein
LSQNPIGLKLSQLLSQYLYQTRKLDLPGIGTFTLDAAAVIPEESERGGASLASGISFKNVNIRTPDDGLIGFIKEYTGKMKPLAAADLDFYLTTGKQLLNIGKPFYLEGIGTLMQNKAGLLDFTPGEYMIARLDEPGAGKKDRTEKKATGFDEAPREYEPRSNNVRQSLLLVGIVIGLIVIGWGGYYLYKRNTYVEPTAENKAMVLPDTATARDTTTVAGSGQPGQTTQPAGSATDSVTTKKSDSPPQVATPSASAPKPPPAPVPQASVPSTATPSVARPGENLYHFVILETSNKNKALRRYNQLLGYQLNIKMDQKDSSFFKLYFPIPAAIRDTTHIRDSLADVYAAHVRIEH